MSLFHASPRAQADFLTHLALKRDEQLEMEEEDLPPPIRSPSPLSHLGPPRAHPPLLLLSVHLRPPAVSVPPRRLARLSLSLVPDLSPPSPRSSASAAAGLGVDGGADGPLQPPALPSALPSLRCRRGLHSDDHRSRLQPQSTGTRRRLPDQLQSTTQRTRLPPIQPYQPPLPQPLPNSCSSTAVDAAMLLCCAGQWISR